MDLRNWLNDHPAGATLAVIALLVVALSALMLPIRGSGAPPTGSHYHVDLETGEWFIAPMGATHSEAGNPAARAYIFSCNACGDPDERFLGYALRSPPPPGVSGRVAVSRDLERWVGLDDPHYGRITNPRCEDGSSAQTCTP